MDNTGINRHISSNILILIGVSSIPAFLLQDNLLFQLLHVGMYIVTAAALGKQIRLLPPAIMLLTITFINLFTPTGRVIFSLGRASVTLGSLRVGIVKSMTLIGLIYLSKATVRSDLRLPGKFGSIITRTFYYFDRIIETWRTIPKQHIIPRLDKLITTIYSTPGETAGMKKSERPKTTPLGFVIALLFILSQWTLFFLQFIVTWDVLKTG